jgi:hypothetical protein
MASFLETVDQTSWHNKGIQVIFQEHAKEDREQPSAGTHRPGKHSDETTTITSGKLPHMYFSVSFDDKFLRIVFNSYYATNFSVC